MAALVEREDELAALARLVEGARAGAGGALVVEGPPGIGKSSLLAAAREAAAGLRVIVARGGELERDYPFGVARQLFEPVLAGDERAALLAGAAALAEPVLAATDGDSDASFSALHGLYWLAVNLAGRQPVLAIVDDVQWADLASLRWLVYLARRLEGVPLALLLATRTADVELLDELRGETERLHPGALSEEAVGTLIRGEPPFVAACHEVTGGNPFLVRELRAELARRGTEPSAANADLARRLSAQGVGRAVRSRLRRLGPDCAALAEAIVVLGEPAEAVLAARLAGLDDGAASVAADRLAEAAILEPQRRLAFVHALVRSSIDAQLGSSERAAAHERAAALLRDTGAPPDRIALHLLASPPRADPATVETLRRAARSATGRGAPDVAVTYLERAVAEPPPEAARPGVAHELGAAALRAGQPDAAIARLRQAVDGLPDPGARAQAANALGSALFQAQRAGEAVAELTAAIGDLPESEREQGLLLQATRWLGATGSVSAWRSARQSPDRFSVASASATTTGERLALVVAAYDAVRGRTADEARTLALRALADGRLLHDPGPESLGFWGPAIVLLLAGALEDATTACSDAIAWAEEHGSLPAFCIGAHLRAYVWWRRGSLADAEADATSALEHAVVPGIPAWGAEALANVLLARGEPDRAEAARPPAPPDLGGVRALWHLDTRARVRGSLDDMFMAGQVEADWDIETPAFCSWRAEAASLLASLDRSEEAVPLAREEVERAVRFGAPGPLGVALRALGLATGDIAMLEQAVEKLSGSPARLDHATAVLELGAALRRAGRRVDAREPLRDALALAADCGADALVARAHEELVAAGARPRRDPTDSRTNLTAGELRVARMAADGLTNREIAQALFLTENTIQTHLRSVFRKLDISSRSQLARSLTENLTDAR